MNRLHAPLLRTHLARARRRDDGGFTVAEVSIAITMVVIVMTALAAFFITSTKATELQSLRQTASQLATDSLDKARTLGGLDAGQTYARDKANSDALWTAGLDTSSSTKFPGVAGYLTNVTEAYDTSTAATTNSALTAPLPICIPGTSPAATCVSSTATVTLNNVSYTRNWFIGSCWVLKTTASTTNTTPCSGANPTTDTQKALYVQYRRVVVAVVWSAGGCANNLCIYISSTMTSASKDPTFDAGLGATKPKIANPGAQVNDVSQTVALTITETGGTAPFTWSATGLPDGLSLVVAAGVVNLTGKPTTAGTFTTVVKVVDGFGFTSTAAFSWTINPAPALTNPGNQVSAKGSTVNLALVSTGGTSPVTFSATGLPAGLSINASTGAITGSPTTVSLLGVPSTVIVKMTDSLNVSDSETFTWLITTPLSVTTPANQSNDTGTLVALAISASGGTSSYTWTATGLPPGLTIGSTTGIVGGSPTTTGTYSGIKVTVTDSSGATATTSGFTWVIGAGLRITAPTATSRSDTQGSTQTIQATATGGTGALTWSATGLPDGMSINSTTGKITGSLTYGYRLLTTISVSDTAGRTASFTFTWNVTGDMTTSGLVNRTDDTGNAITAVTPSATGGNSGNYNDYYWAASGLPAGLSINRNTGVISGTPTTPGVYTVTITTYSVWLRNGTYYYNDLERTMFVWTVTS